MFSRIVEIQKSRHTGPHISPRSGAVTAAGVPRPQTTAETSRAAVTRGADPAVLTYDPATGPPPGAQPPTLALQYTPRGNSHSPKPADDSQVPRLSKRCWVSAAGSLLPLFYTKPVQPNSRTHENWSMLRGTVA